MLPMPKSDWFKRVTHTSLTFYAMNIGESISVQLSPMQAAAVCLILGIDFDSEKQCTMYNDETIKKFMQMEGNPFQLTSLEEYEGNKQEKEPC